jgi:hypothetical protein
VNPTVFLGLVTHRGSRFTASAGPDGLVHRLSDALTALGVPSVVSIHDDDHFDPALVPLTTAQVSASIDAELSLEQRWRVYVDPSVSHVALSAQMAARRAYRRARLAPPWRREVDATDAGARMLRRLVNIELAHLHLMRRAVASGARWTLIVEDDAHLNDPESFARSLALFIAERSTSAQPAYVNVSRSFDHETLGSNERLAPVGSWSDTVRELAADRPLTNTVCAILYRQEFLKELLAQLDEIPIAPVLPIDWKVNAALLSMHAAGQIDSGDCWFLDPAPITQGSMHG